MRHTLTTTMVPAIMVGSLLLGGCGGPERATFEETDPIQQAEAAGGPGSDGAAKTEQPVDQDAATTTTPGDSGGALAPIAWPEAPRELTEIEAEFLLTPGSFAGDAYDEDAVVEAVLAQEPTTAEEWRHAIRAQVQEDYTEDLQTAITFDPSLGEAGAEPTGEGQPPETDAVGTNHFAIVLDASGSMGESAGSGTRMEEARAAIGSFVAALPEGSTVSLRVYGQEGDNTDAGQEVSCASTDTVYDGPAGSAELTAQLEAVEPTGWTPLARGIEAAAQDIPQGATDGIVYVVTDGVETCGGDPVAAAETLAGQGIQPIVNVIGFHTGGADQQALQAIAEAGGGEFTQADSQADLEQYWDEEYTAMMDAWNEWRQVELERIEQEGTAHMEVAEEVGQRLMDAAQRQGDRSMALTERLADDGHLDYDTRADVWGSFAQLKRDMWGYAHQVKVDNWSASYRTKVDAWSEVYDRGTSKWSEYYLKKVGR